MKTLLMLTLLTVPVACAQPKGTVNGQPILDRAFAYPRAQVEIAWRLENKRPIEKDDLPTIDGLVQAKRCSSLKSVIDAQLQDQQMKEMAIAVTPADIAEARKTIRVLDPQEEARRHHEHAAAILEGLDHLLNKHEDSQAVYDQYLKPHKITEQEWAYQILAGQTEAGNKGLMSEMAMNADALAKVPFDSYPVKVLKMKKLIDEQIALSDPKFAQYLAEYNRSVVVDPSGTSHLSGMSGDHLTYLEKQRFAFWQDVHRKAQVVINEPTMQTCDLSEYNGGTKHQ
jgi:hypothetical protein